MRPLAIDFETAAEEMRRRMVQAVDLAREDEFNPWVDVPRLRLALRRMGNEGIDPLRMIALLRAWDGVVLWRRWGLAPSSAHAA